MDFNSIASEAFISDIFCKHWMDLSTSALKYIAKNINYETVPDRIIVDNEQIRQIIRWDRLDKMKLIRIIIRCIDQNVSDLEQIKKGIKQHHYKVKDLSFLFMRKPDFIEFFPIDLNKINTMEAAILLSFGSSYFLDKIDFKKHIFNFRESMNIIQAYKYNREIIENVNFKSLKGYQISEILINTGERDLDLLNISCLTNIDWINLLEVNPEMIKYCDYSKFMNGDIFYSIKLCSMFENLDLSKIILDRNMNDISPLGWEILLINKPEIFLIHCNFSKLEEMNWNYILKIRPELHIYKPD